MIVFNVEDCIGVLVIWVLGMIMWLIIVVLFIGKEDFGIVIVEGCGVLVGKIVVDDSINVLWCVWVGDVEDDIVV